MAKKYSIKKYKMGGEETSKKDAPTTNDPQYINGFDISHLPVVHWDTKTFQPSPITYVDISKAMQQNVPPAPQQSEDSQYMASPWEHHPYQLPNQAQPARPIVHRSHPNEYYKDLTDQYYRDLNNNAQPPTQQQAPQPVQKQANAPLSQEEYDKIVRHQAKKILAYEAERGDIEGKGLTAYSYDKGQGQKYEDQLMNEIYPEVKKAFPNASPQEVGQIMDWVFNAGWDADNKKFTIDPKAYAIQEYYRKYDPSKLDQEGTWNGRKNAVYSFDDLYNNTVGKLNDQERMEMTRGAKDWFYQHRAPSGSDWDLKTKGHHPGYENTWYGRIANMDNTDDYIPNNPAFIYKKQSFGGYYNHGGMIRRADGHYSRRGLWDNIRANRGSGKQPTKEMLEQEAKIKAQKDYGGAIYYNEDQYSLGGNLRNLFRGKKGREEQMNQLTDQSLVDYRTNHDPDMLYNNLLQTLPPEQAIQVLQSVIHADEDDDSDQSSLPPTIYARPTDYDKVSDYYMGKNEEDYGYSNGGYVVKRSNARKGKTHVVIGPDGTKKYFGDSKLGQHPNDPARKKAFYARHKHNLEHNPYFRAFARATWRNGGEVFSAGGEEHEVYIKESPTGNGKGVQGHVMVTHPTKDKGKWDTIDLTEKSGAHTVAQGVAATKQWHAQHPMKKMGGWLNMYDTGGEVNDTEDTENLGFQQTNPYIYSEGEGYQEEAMPEQYAAYGLEAEPVQNQELMLEAPMMTNQSSSTKSASPQPAAGKKPVKAGASVATVTGAAPQPPKKVVVITPKEYQDQYNEIVTLETNNQKSAYGVALPGGRYKYQPTSQKKKDGTVGVVGIGHDVSIDEYKKDPKKWDNGLTEQEIQQLAKQDLATSFNTAARIYNKEYGDGSFQALPSQQQLLFSEMAFNGAYGDYKNLRKAVNTINTSTDKAAIEEAKKIIAKEYVRNWTSNSGKKQPLYKRNEYSKKKLQTMYNIPEAYFDRTKYMSPEQIKQEELKKKAEQQATIEKAKKEAEAKKKTQAAVTTTPVTVPTSKKPVRQGH